MKSPIAEMIALLLRGVAPTAAVASSLFAPVALGAQGDLDPHFADVGRLGPILALQGSAWSLEALSDGGTLLSGGDAPDDCFYCYYSTDATTFISRLSDVGSIDLSFNAARLAHIQVLDVAMQSDGKVVAVGQEVSTNSLRSQLVVFRLQREGPVDSTFGANGIVHLSFTGYVSHYGTSVALDPDGRIVVAGSRDNELVVLRLLADGSRDQTFGALGVYAGPENAAGTRTNILRTSTGGYRVTTTSSVGCQVIALTANGALDNAFGTAGTAPVDAPLGQSQNCSSMVSQPDGRLLVAGSAAGHGFTTRLLVGGQADSSFAAAAVSDTTADATALALGADGSVVVAGTGVSGASIMRLQANGELDVLFGNAGITLIDLPSADGMSPLVHDMIVRPDGGVVAAGGDSSSNRPFAIRLLGIGGGDSPGVLGVTQQSVITTAEPAPEVVVNVRRTGGDSGSVSVDYQAVGGDSRFVGPSTDPATAGQDFVGVSGRLTWNAGDRTEREIRVPILVNNSPEELESFQVTLSNAQGGVGLGTRNATVAISAHGGDPFGQFAIQPLSASMVAESQPAQAVVFRNFWYQGAVSVTVTPIGGTATAGADFDAKPVTLSWADGDSSYRVLDIPIVNDTVQEADEVFTVALSNPTGGAVIGPNSSTTFTIVANNLPPPPPPSSGGGGGAFGYLSLLLLGIAGFLRSVSMALRSR